MVQNEMPVVPEYFLASEKTRGEEQKNIYMTIQSTSKHFVSSLNSRQAVHKRQSSKPLAEWMRLAKKVKSPYISGLISDAWQLTASLCCGFMSALTLMSPTLLFIHSLLSKLLT